MATIDTTAGERTRHPAALLRRLITHLPRPLAAAITAVWHWWLHLLSSRGWMRDFAIPILFTVLARLLVVLFHDRKLTTLGNNTFSEVVFDVSVLLASMLFTRWSITWGVPAMMGHVREIAACTQEPRREFLRDFATAQTASTRDIVRGLIGPGYEVRNPAAMRPWFARFFSQGGGAYIGIDSHRPAEYMTQFEWYLDAHADSLGERDHPRTDQRVLATSRADLSKDWRFARPDYQSFYRWHQDHSVDLKWIDVDEVNLLRERFGIGNADVCLWRHFAVLFAPDPATGISRLRMWFPGEPERGGTTYEKISQFVRETLSHATALEQVAPGLDIVDRELAVEWINYVDPPAREQSVQGFLTSVLSDKRFVFDAAAGIACDSVCLVRHGYQVATNEVDSLLAEQAKAYAESQDVRLQFMGLLWEDLPDQLPGHMRFDALLCLGNSLCLVDDPAGRRQCLDAFRRSLYADGILIIDERNFETMLDNARAINADPLTAFSPTGAGDVMYRGSKIRGYPAYVDKTERVVHWRFFRNSPRIADRSELEERRLRAKDLVLHAFAHGELFGLLQRVGFGSIDVYADLKPVAMAASAMPARAEVAHADFLTYVARIDPLTATTAPTLAAARSLETPAAPGA